MVRCEFDDCDRKSTTVSRLSPEGIWFLVVRRHTRSERLYRRFNYCEKCHKSLMGEVWNRVRDSGKDDDNVALQQYGPARKF